MPVMSTRHQREAAYIHAKRTRHHMEASPDILKNALKSANVTMKDIDIVRYSAGPGLGPCLRVGAVIARTVAGFYKKPLVPVNHALGHIELGAMLTGTLDPLVLPGVRRPYHDTCIFTSANSHILAKHLTSL